MQELFKKSKVLVKCQEIQNYLTKNKDNIQTYLELFRQNSLKEQQKINILESLFADYTFLLAVIWKSKLSTGEVVSLEKIEKINTRLDNIILKEEEFCKFLIGELNE